MMARASRFAPERGERRAARIVGGSATVSRRVNVKGERSLMVSDRRGDGSWVVDLRIWVSGPSRVGSNGGILSSKEKKSQKSIILMEELNVCAPVS